MAPKKLTDCPENLREAIDWLIQVRHGGDGQGLKNLAKALKKLIGDAIEKAEQSLNAEKDKFVCPFQYSPTETNCQHYQAQLENREKEIQKSNRQQDVENDKEVQLLTDKIKDCNSRYHNERYRDPSKQKVLDDIEDRQKTLGNLKTKLEAFVGKIDDTEQENIPAKSVLENLCSGLETFLGFDSTSKGYTGKGIVYSDLDRLCDGVMGFLSGVLGAVKDDPSVKTYDIHETNNFNNAIKTIKNSMYTANGLSKAVEAVSQALGEWDREVTEKTDKLNKAFKKLNRINDNFSKQLNSIDVLTNDTVKNVADRLGDCIEEAERLSMAFDTAQTAYNALDAGLKRKIQGAVGSAEVQIKAFVAAAQNDELKAVVVTAGDKLKVLEERVNNKVTELVHKMERDINTHFDNQIRYPINEVNEKLKKVEKDLGLWIKGSTNILNKAIDKCEKIIRMVAQDGNSDAVIYKSAVTLKSKAIELRGAAEAARDAVQNQVKATLGAVNTMNTVLMADLYDVNQSIKSGVWAYFEKLLKALDEGAKNAKYIPGKQDKKSGVEKLKLLLRDISPEFLKLLTEGTTSDKDTAYNLEWILNTLNPHHHALTTFSESVKVALKTDLAKPVEDQLPSYGMTVDTKKLTSLKTYREHVSQDNLPELKQGRIEGAQEKALLPKTIKNIETTGLSALIKPDISRMLSTDTTFQEPFDAIQEQLTEITNLVSKEGDFTVDDTQKGVKSLLGELTKMIDSNNKNPLYTGLKSIQERIDYILRDSANYNCLLKILERASRFNKTVIQSQATEAIDNLKAFISSKVTELTLEIQEKAKSEYHSKVDGIFKTMKTKVEYYILEINDIIEDDSKRGVKGLLSRLYDKQGGRLAALKSAKGRQNKYTFVEMSKKLKEYLDSILLYTEDQVMTPPPPKQRAQKTPTEQSEQVKLIKGNLDILLDVLQKSNHFDHQFSYNYQKLDTTLSALHPKKFTTRDSPELLDTLSKGMSGLTRELQKVYISTYSGSFKYFVWNGEVGNKCAKIGLTLISILYDGLSRLRKECDSKSGSKWNHKPINLGKDNGLGAFLDRRGFIVSSGTDDQNGELRNEKGCRGDLISDVLLKHNLVSEYDDNETNKESCSTLKMCVDYLHEYYQVRHLSSLASLKHPSTIYEMLCWLSGLPHNLTYKDLKTYVKNIFQVSDKRHPFIGAYPHPLSSKNILDLLKHSCSESHAIIVAILGNGHVGGIYACDFYTNESGLLYPTDMNSLICMLQEILNRLYFQLYFLYQQCEYDTSLSGWLDCEYGRGVGGSGWRCNVDQCANQTCKQKGGQRANQNGNQKADQRCQEHPKCGVKSPLQSFLEDGLQGFLPHHLKSERGKLECSLKSHSGLPCITPMGFSGISNIASHRATGQRILDALGGYCGHQSSPLAKLCSRLNCLLPSVPKTLGDLFAFYHQFLINWSGEHKKIAFNDCVTSANLGREYGAMNECAMLFESTDHSTSHGLGDFNSLLTVDNACYVSDGKCGAYLDSLSYEICGTFSKRNATLYLSWIIYLTETLYDLFYKLLKECENNCGSGESKCQITGCDKNYCFAFKPQIGHEIGQMHTHLCDSMLSCSMTFPTLYSFGLVFGGRRQLSGRNHKNYIIKRSCKDLVQQLQIVLNERSIFSKILHDTIPNFLWTIREPFSYFVLTLWLLSLLYLLHIMLIRLDLFHIKSHLHSPSSHRIAAQSLLAAARVGRLAKISYLQA